MGRLQTGRFFPDEAVSRRSGFRRGKVGRRRPMLGGKPKSDWLYVGADFDKGHALIQCANLAERLADHLTGTVHLNDNPRHTRRGQHRHHRCDYRGDELRSVFPGPRQSRFCSRIGLPEPV